MDFCANSAISPEHIGSEVETELLALAARAGELAGCSRAPSTIKTYRSDWNQFENWCEAHNQPALPSNGLVVSLYIVKLAEEGIRPATIEKKLTSISQRHKIAGCQPPTASVQVREVLKGIKRQIGTKQDQKAPLDAPKLKKAVGALPDDIAGIRNSALLLIGFSAALRRSELVALDVADLRFTSAGLVITIRRSKTDQYGSGRVVGVPRASDSAFCPVDSLKNWLHQSGITTGPVFRGIDRHGKIRSKRLSTHGVSLIIKKAVKRIGLNPEKYSGHSLRSGFATSAARAGLSEHQIRKTTGHTSSAMVRRYVRDEQLFPDEQIKRLL